MVGCSIRNCKSRSEKGGIIRFYSFPKNESVANEWLRYCGLKTTCKNGRVCSKHFTVSDYIKPLQHILMNESPRKVRKLKPDAIPTLQIDSVEKSNSTDLTAKSTVCTGGQTDNCETKENYDISAPSCNINLKAAVHIKCEPESDTTPASNVKGSSNVVEESDNKIAVSEAEYKILKKKVDEYEVVKINLKQFYSSDVVEDEESDNKIAVSEAEYKLLKKKVDEYEVVKINLKQISSSNAVEESDNKIAVSEAEYKLLKKKVDEYEVVKINLKQISPSNVVEDEESDNKIAVSEAEYNLLKKKVDEYEVVKINLKQICSSDVEESDNKIAVSEADYNLLKKKVDEHEVVKINLKQIFTPGQIRCLTKPSRHRVRWSTEDIAAAISLRSVSPKGYRHLRATVGIPLPAFSTLCKWASKFDIEPGVLENVITLMKFKAKSFNSLEKLVTLSFDEIYLSNRIEIDKKFQQTVGPHKTCQCIMARSLCGKWKQPIYFQYDQKMTKAILFDVIKKLHDAGLTVVTVTCDMGTGNQGLLRSLNVGVEEGQLTYFQHPSDSNLKVHVFFDVPHLLKLARNHFIDHGFEYERKNISKKTIEKVLSLSEHDLKLAHKITPQHLNLVGSQRQKVRPAAQLFSNTTARAVEWCGIKDFLPGENWLELSYILKAFNDWFDVFNARMKYEGNKTAYGLNLEAQNLVLDKMNHITNNIKTGQKMSNKTPFQRGILISNKSLLNLFQDLTERFQLEYILTHRLNQDILENFFSYIRGMGATNDHPTALSFKHRLKWYILGKHSADVFKYSSSTLEDPSIACLISPLDNPGTSLSCNPLGENIVDEERVVTGILSSYTKSVDNENNAEDCSLISLLDSDVLGPEQNVFDCDLRTYLPTDEEEQLLKDLETQDEISQQGLKFIAGYVASRFMGKYPHLGDQTRNLAPESGSCEWINFISRGKLIYPCKELIKVAQTMENEFEKYHGQTLCKDKFIFKSLADIVHKHVEKQYPQIDYAVILCLVRTRTYIRLKELNKKIVSNQLQKKLKRKLHKVSNTVY